MLNGLCKYLIKLPALPVWTENDYEVMEERVDELIILFEERSYVCLYNMKSREYRNKKTFAMDDNATALAIIVARLLVQL